MTILVVQSRIGSSRLYGKALLPLGGKPVLAWVLDAMKKVPADRYFLATDAASAEQLFPVAESCGWECFAGSEYDVLARFCLLIRQCADEGSAPDTVIRATGDNPFLFYEAAAALADCYEQKKARGETCDYMTWTGLPHGSGVELFSATSLLAAWKQTDEPYDHEHVGPALYNHPDRFVSLMMPAPASWTYPQLRTTIDTPADYRRAVRLVRTLSGEPRPFSAARIAEAALSPAVARPVLCVPSVTQGHGTGHLRRCLAVAERIGADVYIPESCTLPGVRNLVGASHLDEAQIVTVLPETAGAGESEYALVLCDAFSLSEQEAAALHRIAPVAAIDEGSGYTGLCDYLLDIIPSAGYRRRPNYSNPGFIPLPEAPAVPRNAPGTLPAQPEVLVAVGGEDPAGLAFPAATAFARAGCSVTVIADEKAAAAAGTDVPDTAAGNIGASDSAAVGTVCGDGCIRVVQPADNLSSRLAQYDLVVTHYGFTAFEALAAGCAVVLLGTSKLHVKLAAIHSFACLKKEQLRVSAVKKLLSAPDALYNAPFLAALTADKKNLADFAVRLASGTRYACPVCGDREQNGGGAIVARSAEKTYRRCTSCGLVYLSWSMQDKKTYGTDYFFSDYKKQYGKTYLEDFDHIKQLGQSRIACIAAVCGKKMRRRAAGTAAHTPSGAKEKPSVLDIGCAYGPFLSAAADAGWEPFGTDVSKDAVSYVSGTLGFAASCAGFPDFDPAAAFGRRTFDAVTMWFVAEHFPDLHRVLHTVSGLLPGGGVFAFSTPSGSGVSARYSADSFYEASPGDHFSVMTPRSAKKILALYGFKAIKIVSTGHHPERFPFFKKHAVQPGGRCAHFLSKISRIFCLGDTFEIYCVKK